MNVGIKKLRQNVQTPEAATELSACSDLRASLRGLSKVRARSPDNTEHELSVVVSDIGCWITLPPDWRVLLPTGIIVDIPEGHSARVHPRSGLSYKNGLTVVCGEGVIDEDYQEELFIPMINLSSKAQFIYHDDRVAQLEIVKDIRATFTEVETLSDKNSTRAGGLGHTGTT